MTRGPDAPATRPPMPPVTAAHRQAAYARLALRGWTYTAAMQDPVRSRVIEAMAAQMRTAEWRAQHARTVRTVRRIEPVSGRWCTQRVAGDWDGDCLSINTEDDL